MVDSPSVSYFPLKSNARALVSGGAALSVVRRVKIASLLHDHVILEDGVYDIDAGPGGSAEFWRPPRSGDPHSYQTPRERRMALEGGFSLSLKPSGASDSTPATVVLTSENHLAWRPTFEPLKATMPGNLGWIEFARFSPTDEAKSEIARRVRSDLDDDRLLPGAHHFVRSRVVTSVNEDLVVGLGWAVSIDAFHRQLIRHRIKAGQAVPVLGHQAFHMVLPQVETLEWGDIDELRRTKGLAEFRSLLRDIEQAAREQAGSGRSLRDEFKQRRTLAEQHLRRLTITAQGLGVAIGLVVGASELALGIPDPGIVGSAVGMGIAKVVQKAGTPRWMTFQAALEARAG